MITEEEIQKIKETTGEFLTNIGAVGFVVDVGGLTDIIEINITLAQEPQFLIGQEGKTLLDLQRLLGILLNRALGKACYLKLDINGYWAKKVELLKNMAQEFADQVALTRLAKTLPPMSSYERRIIHAELTERSDVITQSQGEGPERCVVIAPK